MPEITSVHGAIKYLVSTGECFTPPTARRNEWYAHRAMQQLTDAQLIEYANNERELRGDAS